MITPGKDGQMQEQIDISKTSAIKCETCENQTFKQSLLLFIVSNIVFTGVKYIKTSPLGLDFLILFII